jgi:hypothetical protein
MRIRVYFAGNDVILDCASAEKVSSVSRKVGVKGEFAFLFNSTWPSSEGTLASCGITEDSVIEFFLIDSVGSA